MASQCYDVQLKVKSCDHRSLLCTFRESLCRQWSCLWWYLFFFIEADVCQKCRRHYCWRKLMTDSWSRCRWMLEVLHWWLQKAAAGQVYEASSETEWICQKGKLQQAHKITCPSSVTGFSKENAIFHPFVKHHLKGMPSQSRYTCWSSLLQHPL